MMKIVDPMGHVEGQRKANQLTSNHLTEAEPKAVSATAAQEAKDQAAPAPGSVTPAIPGSRSAFSPIHPKSLASASSASPAIELQSLPLAPQSLSPSQPLASASSSSLSSPISSSVAAPLLQQPTPPSVPIQPSPPISRKPKQELKSTHIDMKSLYIHLTPLHFAARRGDLDEVRKLLAAADPHAPVNDLAMIPKTKMVSTPFSEAAENGHIAIMDLLYAHNANISRNEPLGRGGRKDQLNAVDWMMKLGAPLARAGQTGQLDAVNWIITHKNLGQLTREEFLFSIISGGRI